MLKLKSVWLIIICLVVIGSMISLPSMTKASGSFISGSYGGKSYSCMCRVNMILVKATRYTSCYMVVHKMLINFQQEQK